PKGLRSGNYVTGWRIQLSLESKLPSPALFQEMVSLAQSNPGSPVQRLYLASALQRLPMDARYPILKGLVAHAEDAGDHNLPLMYWYAAEPLAEHDAARALELALASQVPPLPQFMARRIASIAS